MASWLLLIIKKVILLIVKLCLNLTILILKSHFLGDLYLLK